MKRTSLLVSLIMIASLLAACGPAQTPEVIEKEVVVEKQVPITVEVEKEVVVEKKVVETVEVIKEVEVTPVPAPVTEPGEDEVVTITWWATERGRDTAATRELHYQMARTFEETHPNTKVAVALFPSRGFSTRVLTAISAGQGPDLWYHYYATDIAAQGFIEDLTPYIEASGFDPQDRWFNIGNIRGLYDGRYYAVPRDATAIAIGYNKDIFDAAGVPYPEEGWTMADFREKAIALTDSDNNVYGFQWFDSGWFQWNIFGYNTGPDFIGPDGRDIVGYMDTPEALEAYRWIMDLHTVDQIAGPPGLADQFGLDFLSGQIAMFVFTTWDVDLFTDKVDFNYGFVSPPSWEEGEESVPWTDSYMFYMNSASPHKQRVWEFLEFLSGPEGGMMMAEAGVWAPAVRAVWEEMGWTTDDMFGPIYDELQKPTVVLNYERSQFYWDCVGGIWDEIVGQYVEQGNTDLESYVPELVAQGQACLDENYAALGE